MTENNKIRIIFFSDILIRNFDGVSNTMFQLIDRLPTDRIDVLFITSKCEVDEFPFDVVVVPSVVWPFQRAYSMGVPWFHRKLTRTIKDFRPHIVHFSSPSLLGRYALKYAKSREIPVTTSYHTHFDSYFEYYFPWKPLEQLIRRITNPITKSFYQKVNCTFVPSLPMKSYLLKIGVANQHIKFFRRGVDVRQFNPSFRDQEFRRYWHIENDDPIVLFVSRIVEEKDLKTLEKVYHLFLSNGPKVNFVITGDGNSKKRLQSSMKSAIFTGKQTKVSLARIYANSDVFIFPSITETFGNVVLESLASGTPVVVAAAGGPQGIAERSKGGIVVPKKDAKAFYVSIKELLIDDEKRKYLGKNGIKYAANESWDSICGKFYDDLIEIVKFKNSPSLNN